MAPINGLKDETVTVGPPALICGLNRQLGGSRRRQVWVTLVKHLCRYATV